MDNGNRMRTNLLFAGTISFFILSVWGSPVQIGASLRADSVLKKSNDLQNTNYTLNCNPVEFAQKEVIFLKSNNLFLNTDNTTVHFTSYRKEGDKLLVCLSHQNPSGEEIILNCTDKFAYDSDEFEILPNKSALVHGIMINPAEYKLRGKELLTCAPEIEDYSGIEDDTSIGQKMGQVSIYVGIVGSAISIASLIAHLITFCFVPTLRNLPGYNLASLSVAFLLAYSFTLIGQIPQVLDLFCVISGVLQLNFFLTAFFCMNVLAFDVWRTLKLATEKLAVGSQRARKRQLLWYSVYAWGCPLVISIMSVFVDNFDIFPENIKPQYGNNDTCWLTNNVAKTIFFVAPAFTLIAMNGVFFVKSTYMIFNNQMRSTNDQSQKTVKLNYILYVRLGLMMGLTWLMGVLAVICKNSAVWFISDLLNSLQGLFLFLLFTCTRKVLKLLRQRRSSKKSFSEKETTISTSLNHFSSKK